MPPFLVITLQFFASLSILVMIHEFGHFIMARIFKVRVDKFYLFFNPWFTLFKHKSKRSGTEYGVGWLPLGGYVKMAGMIDESMDTQHVNQAPQPWEFRSKPAWQRLLIIVMGVVNNFILALLIYSMTTFVFGERYIPFQNITEGMEFSDLAKSIGFEDGDILLRADNNVLDKPDDSAFRTILTAKQVTVLRNGAEANVDIPDDFILRVMEENKGFVGFRFPFVVDSVLKDSRAHRAGLTAGDQIIRFVNDNDINDINDNDTTSLSLDYATLKPLSVSTVTDSFASHRNLPMHIVVRRENKTTHTTTDTTLLLTPDANGKIGVYMKSLAYFYEIKTKNYSFLESFGIGIHKGVGRLTGYASDMKYVFTKAGAQSLGGFMTIGSLFPYPFNAQSFWEMTAFLSIILAFMNILPIPALDGGHAMFIIYEIITRRKPSTQFVMRAQMVGMFLLFLLLIYANMNDVFRLFQ